MTNITDLKTIKIVEDNDSQFLNIHSGAIHIENKVNLKQRLAWLYMLFKARNNFHTEDIHRISITELKKAIGYTSRNNKILKEDLRELRKTEIEWNIFLKDKTEIWGNSSLLAEVEIIDGFCEYSYAPKLKKRFLNPNMYAKLNLMISKKFKSKNTLAIYTLAIDYLQVKNNYGEKNLTVNELRKYLGLESEQYPRTTDLHKHIIRKAEKEINEESDIEITIIPIRTDRTKIDSFKLKMTIKEEFLESYKPLKVIKSFTESKQTNLFELPLEPEPKKPLTKNEKIEVKDPSLKEFFAEYKISVTTNTVQEKFKDIKDRFQNRFEDYLIFLMKYTKQELKRANIKNISGFYVGLLKDDNQLENYIIDLQHKEKDKQSKQIKINSLVETELKKLYESYLSNDFENYLLKNINELEAKIINIIQVTTKAGEFFRDVILSKHNNGLIDKTLLTETKPGTKAAVIGHLKDHKDKLNYESLSFESWKAEEVSKEKLTEIEEKIIKNV